MKFKGYVWMLGLLWLLTVTAPAALCDDVEGSISSESRSHDPRLEHKVTLGAGQVALGAMLAEMSAQSGVALNIDERDVFSGIPVFAMVNDVPLADAMSALRSLLSFSGATWKWELEGKDDHCTYSLVPTLAAHNLAFRLRGESMNLYKAHATVMMRIAQMTPEERKKQVKELSASLLQSDDAIAQAWVDYDVKWEGLRTVAESISPEVQEQVFRGERTVTLPVSKLSSAGIGFLDHYLARTNPSGINPDGSHSLRSKVTDITIAAPYHGNITPTVCMYVDNTGFSFIGGPGLDRGLADRLGKQWLLPGDMVSSPSEKLVSSLDARPRSNPGDSQDDAKAPITKAVKQLAQTTPVSILALLADDQQADPGPPYGMTIAAYLSKLHENSNIQRKWNGDTLLLCSPIRFADDATSIPYRLIKQFTRTGVHGRNFLSLSELAAILTQLKHNQLAYAATQFAVIRGIQRMAPLLAVYYTDRDLGRTSGLPLNPELRSVLGRVVNLPPEHDVMTGTAERLRLAVLENTQADMPTRRVIVEYMKPDRKWVQIGGIGIVQVGTSSPK